MGLSSFLLLLSCLGLAITSQAQDCTTPIGGPNMSLKDADILLEQFPVGSQVSFICDVGYTSAGGSRTITCTADGWTRLAMRCERKNCGAFDEVENGHIDYPDLTTEFGDRLVITCNTGHILVGRGELLCEDGGWNGRKPTCEPVPCDPPAQIAHGSFSPEGDTYSYRDVVQYSCQRDFTLNGSTSASCSADGTFKPAPPTCIKVQCEEPVIKNAVWVSGSRPPYGHKATVTHKCNTGFKMIGQQTIVCELNSTWSPKPPTCEPVTCAPLPNVEHGSFSPVKESYNYGDVVQYSCQTGFAIRGSKSISCSEDGTFNSAPPTCTPVTCAPLPNVEHGSFSPVKQSYSHRDVVQYSCQTGFTLSGSKSVSCSDDGTFKPAPPTCTQVTCAPLPIEHGSFSPVKQSYSYRDVVQYSCQTGFAISGSKSISCSDDGTFKPAPPTCTRIPTTTKATTTTTTTTTKAKGGTDEDDKTDDDIIIHSFEAGVIVGIVIGALAAFGLFVLLCLVITWRCFGWLPWFCFGCLPCWKEGADRTHPDDEEPKVLEIVPLSPQPQ